MYNKYQRLVLEGSADGVNWVVQEPIQYKAGDLIEENSSDCGGSGEGIKYRWVSIPGEFMCINNDKYTVIKKQVYSVDKEMWIDVEPIETTYGELVEKDSGYCGYGEYWADTENWECASVSDAHTTKITCYDGGSCLWSYNGNQGVVGGQYWLDTIGGGKVYLEAMPLDSIRMPMKVMYIDGVSTTSSVVSIAGNTDHNVSLYFYSKSLWNVAAGENYQFMYTPKPPFKVEDGEIATISAWSEAPAVGGGAWAFDHWSVWYDYDGYEPQQFDIYYSNPLKLVVTSDCRVDLYFKNEAAKTGYTLVYNDGAEVQVSDQKYLRPSVWFFSSTWFIENWFNTLATKRNASPNTLLYIDSYCFTSSYSSWASGLQSVEFPTVEVVYASAFQGLSFLSHVGIEGCRQIYNDAFKNCTALSTISLPNCTELGARCFMGCTSLTKVYLLGTYCSLAKTNLGYVQSQFYNCPNLKSIIVPAALYSKYKSEWGSYSGLIKSY